MLFKRVLFLSVFFRGHNIPIIRLKQYQAVHHLLSLILTPARWRAEKT